jgi:hypothetical protein
MFAMNGDFGDPSDLQGIVVMLPIGPLHPADPREDFGEPGSILGVPFRVGSAFIKWNALGFGIINLDLVAVTARDSQQGAFVVGDAAFVEPVMLGNMACPEPSSMVMLAGMLAVAGLWRRTV